MLLVPEDGAPTGRGAAAAASGAAAPSPTLGAPPARDDVARLAFYLAAIVHDYGHQGVNKVGTYEHILKSPPW